jgi:type III secretion system YscQ/HrcQ family protein
MDWRNCLSEKTEELMFVLDNSEDMFSVHVSASTFSRQKYTIGILVEIEGVVTAIWLSAWPLQQKIDSYLDGKTLKELPLKLRIALLETALKPLLSAITQHATPQFRILNFINLKLPKLSAFSLELRLRDERTEEKIKVLIPMHNKLYPVMRKIFDRWPKRENYFWHQQAIRVYLEAGTLELSYQELNQLELSDILLMEVEDTNKLTLRLRLPSGDTFPTEMSSPMQLTIQSGIQTMSDEHNDENLTSIQQIPIRLSFDLGDLEIPFEQLQYFKQGHIIDLKKPVSQSVTIRSLNRVIGTGELVEVDGNMAVKIVKLFSQQSSDA